VIEKVIFMRNYSRCLIIFLGTIRKLYKEILCKIGVSEHFQTDNWEIRVYIRILKIMVLEL
jgi:hypothetical protein